MDTLVSVLLYLNVIHPGSYKCSEIAQLQAENHSVIYAIKRNDELSQAIMIEYAQEERDVIIIDTMSGGCWIPD